MRLPTLLIISDNPSIRYWVKKHLEDQYFVLEAVNRISALEAIRNSQLDFILIDSGLEGTDPLELTAEMKQILRTLTPILLITGRLKRSYLESALDAGVTDFLNDQLDPEELAMRIATGKKAHSLREKTSAFSTSITKKTANTSKDYLKNKVLLQDSALSLIQLAKENNIPLTALLVRIDRFDEIQKKMGDSLTEKILQLLKRILSPSDLIIPSTEERFIIILHNTTPEKAKGIVETISKQVNQQLHVSVSTAVSTLGASETDFNRIVKASNQALKDAAAASNIILSIEPEKP
jgi:diguanylate cyclase (GGDEF)-like protein